MSSSASLPGSPLPPNSQSFAAASSPLFLRQQLQQQQQQPQLLSLQQPQQQQPPLQPPPTAGAALQVGGLAAHSPGAAPATYTIDSVLAAIHSLYGNADALPDAARRRKEADIWLKDFQKTPEAWTIADALIRLDGVMPESQLFAAQTLRQKVRHDLDQLATADRLLLRDSLLSSLLRFRSGPRTVSTPLSMAIARLAILLPEWEAPLQQLFSMFRDPQDVGLLLNMIGALPDEFDQDRNITLSKEEFRARRHALVTQNANEVLHMLMVIVNSDLNEDLQFKVLDCLCVWIRSGDITVVAVASTQLVERAFYVLNQFMSPDTFDKAVDLICEIITSSGRELSRSANNSRSATDPALYMPVIQSIYTCLQPLVPVLKKAVESTESNQNQSADDVDDEDKVRGLCNIFAIAGEYYLPLILNELEAWKGIVDGILVCTASSDFEIVPITFQFWSMVADEITTVRRDVLPNYIELYRLLIDIMIKHLHYPLDMKWTPKERDEFRDFRHSMGQVLKVCVSVLGEEEALLRPYKVLTGFVLNGAGPGAALDPSVPWQQIEAPLFALRTMGRKISDDEGRMLPEIMEMLPRLPGHPKVRYAAILVIGRYASWTKKHPEFIPYQMNFISKGFQDNESTAAACQALKYLCEECGEMMVDYLSQLHPFYMKTVNEITRYERLDLVKALASVIRHVPVVAVGDSPDQLKVLEMFCLPIAQHLHQVGSAGKSRADMDKAVVSEVCDLLEQFSSFLYDCQPPVIPPGAANPCVRLFQSMWPVLSSLLDLGNANIHVEVAKVISGMVDGHAEAFYVAIGDVLPKLVSSYAETEFTPLLWASSKFVRKYGASDENTALIMRQLVEALSQTAFKSVQAASSVNSLGDVIEDYFGLLSDLVNECPIQFLQSPLLQAYLECAIACMPIEDSRAWCALYLDFLKPALALATPNRPVSIPDPILAPLLDVVRTNRHRLLSEFVRCLIHTFPLASDVRRDREEETRAVFGSVFVAIWDVVVGSSGSDGAGSVPPATVAEAASIVGAAVEALAMGVPIFNSDAEQVAFLGALAT
ncbi:armadillo-type protein [Zopfochytrium polystomum]|nr:armadillo-type protein [Zopfochytrium polystomum]